MNELSPRSKALLQLARHADVPEAETRRRVARSLGVRLAASAGAAALGTAVSKTALGKSAAGASLTLFAAKTIVLAGAGAALTFGAVEYLTPAPLPPLSSVHSAASVHSIGRVNHDVQARARAALSSGEPRAFDDRSSDLANAERSAAEPAAPSLASQDKSNGAPSSAEDTPREPSLREPSVQPRPAVGGVAALSAPLGPERERTLPRSPSGAFELEAEAYPAQEARTPLEPSADSSVTLLAESDALREAQQALRAGEGRKALRLLQLQDQRFSAGALHQERAAARVLALCQAGDAQQARSEAQRFEQRWPRSPLLARVRSACQENPAQP